MLMSNQSIRLAAAGPVPEITQLRGRLQKIMACVRFRCDSCLRFALAQLLVEETLSILQATVVILVEQPSADHQTRTPFAVCEAKKNREKVSSGFKVHGK